MSISSFLKLVEIRTKVASIIPFLLGTFYSLYRYDQFNLQNFIFMFISLITIDMATTAINNYVDYKKAIKTHGFNYEQHNTIVNDKLSERSVVAVIIGLLLIASILGLILFLNTDLVVLMLGVISFVVGILYSFGPVPISRMPLGEIFSGTFMGFVILFISTYIHVYDKNIASIVFTGQILNVSVNFVEILYIFLFSIPVIFGIANIMLANNICDIEDDISNKRYTLPIYIGKDKALRLFKSLYHIAYIDLIALVVMKIVPITSLLLLLTLIPLNKNIQLFFEKQTKKDTFVLAVKNFVLINMVQTLIIGVTILYTSFN